MSDWKYATFAALVLLGAAAFIVFVIHLGGFEGQIAWFFGLLPGAIIGAIVADRFTSTSFLLSSITYWAFVLCISLLWYFAISYAVIKICHLVSAHFDHR